MKRYRVRLEKDKVFGQPSLKPNETINELLRQDYLKKHIQIRAQQKQIYDQIVR